MSTETILNTDTGTEAIFETVKVTRVIPVMIGLVLIGTGIFFLMAEMSYAKKISV